ncbi:MAG TPA: ABC transporter permease [Candidatus Limnocylindrales bacterium]|nr:ABC transporter permease [Candidatus Limnocylindrales bacterium]
MTALSDDSRELRVVQRRGSWALASREMRRVMSLWTQTLLPPVLTGVIFLAIFGGALGGQLRTIVGVEYLRFILPGLLVMTVAGQAFANNSTSLFQAKNEGYIEDVLTSPIPPWQLLLGYMSGGLLRGWLSALVLALVAAPFAGGVDQPWLTLFALVLTGLIFAALGVITGMWADSFDQHSFIASVLITPLALVAGVFYAPDRLGQPWQTLTRLDPIYYLVDATRHGYTGAHETSTVTALAVAAVAAATIIALAVTLLRRGWRLKA